jgi:hypothetical protein
MRRLWLALAYFLLITPAGLLARPVHDPLRRRWNRRATSYWILDRRYR